VSTEPNIKYRVTGAMVLIALAVIFLPLILDGQKKNQSLDSSIPEKPISGEIILIKVDDIESSEKSEANEATTDTPIIAEKVLPLEIETLPKSKTPDIKKETITNEVADQRPDRPNYKSTAFVIQLGSFSNKGNAQTVVDKLKSAGYKAYLKESNSKGKILNRVLVGPEIKRDQAESKIDALTKLTGLKAIIVSYDPLIH